MLDTLKLNDYQNQLQKNKLNNMRLTELIQITSIYRHLIKYVQVNGTSMDQDYFKKLNERYKILANDNIATTFVIQLFNFSVTDSDRSHFLDTISEINRDKGHLIQIYDQQWKQLRPINNKEALSVINALNNFICKNDLTEHHFE